MGNLLARWACILASVLLYFPILKCMAKISFILLHKNQPGMQTHYLRHHESPAEVNALSAVKRQLEDLAGLTLLGSLCWFSSRQDKQRAIDLRKSFSQAREPCSCVMRWPPRQDSANQCFALWLKPHSVVPMFTASRAVIAVMDVWLNIGACRGS